MSFQVEEGDLFGLLGPNGAGKSTLIAILSCLLPATSGRCNATRGTPISDNVAARRLIGIVPQDLAIYPDLTARENLLFFGKLYGIGGQELSRRVDEVLDVVALIDRAADRTGAFSGGMKRRLNLGAALIHRPRILFLDEPTVGVDPQSRNHIFEGVRRLNAAGTTIIYTSHYMEEVQALCTRVGILDHGRLIACDSLPAFSGRLTVLSASTFTSRRRGWPSAWRLFRRNSTWPTATFRAACRPTCSRSSCGC